MTLQPPTQAPKPPSLGLRIVSSHDEEGHAKPCICLIGDNMVGKTNQALTFPGPFVINFGNNSTILAQPKPVPYMQVGTSAEMLAIAKQVHGHKMTELVQAGLPDYQVQTIIVDSTSDMSVMLDLELDVDSEKRGGYGQKLLIENKFLSLLLEGTRFRPGKEQYNLIWISHFKAIMGGTKSELIEYRHNISGKFYDAIKAVQDCTLELKKDLPASPDGSGNTMRNSQPRYSVLTVGSHKFKGFVGDRLGGRGRYGRLPTEMPLPDGVGLFSLLEKHWHGEPPKLKATPEQVEKLGEIMGEFLAPK